MSSASDCPDDQSLRQLLLGRVMYPEAERLEEHLARCTRCAAEATRLYAQDTLADAVSAAPASVVPPGDEVLSQLLSRLKDLPASLSDTCGQGVPEVKLPSRAAGSDALPALLAPPQQPDEIGRLGGYRVLRLLGAGGMGYVFHAEDAALRRPVALKVMRPDTAEKPAARERFLREARAASAVQHDHIVTIYQVGEDRGVPFLAMQLLEGESLDNWVRRDRRPSVAELHRLGREAAEGLAAAHRRGLVHRDIKPDNIWLEAPNGRVKLLDFGLARAAEEDVQLTQTGTIIGTPAYMSPEQARSETVDARSDLFSLGCVLYRLAAGEPAFRGNTTMALLSSLALDSPRPVRELNPELPSDFADLVMRLLAKRPADRPQSADEVAQALRHVELSLTDPTDRTAVASRSMAMPTGSPEPTVVFDRPPRRRGPWVAVAAGLILVLGGLAAYQVIIRIKHPDGTVTEIKPPPGSEVDVVRNDKPSPIQGPSPFDALRREQITSHELMIAGVGDPGKAPPELVAVLGDSRLKQGCAVTGMAFRPDGRRLTTSGRWLTDWDPVTGQAISRRLIAGHTFSGLAYSPDGSHLAGASSSNLAKVWDAATGKELFSIEGHSDRVCTVVYGPHGRRLVTSSLDGTVRVWDAQTGKEQYVYRGHRGPVYGAAFSPDGKWVASVTSKSANGAAGEAKVWGPENGQEGVALQEPGGTWSCVAYSPDGKRLAAGAWDGVLRVWDALTGQTVLTRKERAEIWGLSFSPDGKHLAVPVKDGVIQVLDVAAGQDVFTVSLPRVALSVAYSPDGKRLAAGDNGGTVKVWDAATGQEVLGPGTGHVSEVLCVAVTPDGRRVASGGSDQTIRVWDVPTGLEVFCLRGHTAQIESLAFSPNGARLATASRDTTVRLWDLTTGKPGLTYKRHRTFVWEVAFSPDGKRVASVEDRAVLHVWDPATGEPERSFEQARGGVAFSPDGRSIVMGTATNGTRLCDAATGQEAWSIQAGGRNLRFSPDGRWVAAAVENSGIKLWDAATGREVRSLSPGNSPFALSPDGTRVIYHDPNRGLLLHEISSGKVIWQRAWPARANALVFAPDGRHVVTGDVSGTVSVFRLPESAPPPGR